MSEQEKTNALQEHLTRLERIALSIIKFHPHTFGIYKGHNYLEVVKGNAPPLKFIFDESGMDTPKEFFSFLKNIAVEAVKKNESDKKELDKLNYALDCVLSKIEI